MEYWYRYAHGDEVMFVHEGTGMLESQFGTLRYGPGDYLVIPTGVIWRMLPDAAVEQRMLVVETSGGHIEPPQRYVNNTASSSKAHHTPSATSARPRQLSTHDEEGEFEVRVKARGHIARYFYRHHPLDVVGWDGHLWPFAFNIEDFEPITGRVHQPPPVHQTFDGPGFVLCSFVPRLFDYHPLAIPAPYNHSNVDSDEVIYYVKGEFMSRRGIELCVDHRAPQRHPARPASRDVRGIDRQGADRRTGGDGGHLPSASAHHAGGRARRRQATHSAGSSK